MFVPFENLIVTTQTYVVHMDVTIPIVELYNAINCVPLNQTFRKKMDLSSETIADGDIVSAQHKNIHKGIERQVPNKQSLNVVTIIVKYGAKLYNVKIPSSGKVQLTGCRNVETVVFLIYVIVKLLRKHELVPSRPIHCLIRCVMSNTTISLPFQIDRDRLHEYINYQTEHISLLEKSVGNVGVNIKIKSNKKDATIDTVTFELDNRVVLGKANVDDISNLCTNRRRKEVYNSFLVFESGKVIMSGSAWFSNRKDAYQIFMGIILGAQSVIALK